MKKICLAIGFCLLAFSGAARAQEENRAELRRKLTAAGASPDLIETERGVGYRLRDPSAVAGTDSSDG